MHPKTLTQGEGGGGLDVMLPVLNLPVEAFQDDFLHGILNLVNNNKNAIPNP